MPEGRHEDQALTEIALVEKELPEGGGNPALVPAVPHPFDDPVQEPSWVEVGFQLPAVIPRADAEPVHAHDQPGSLACPQGVPVDAHDPREGAAIGLHVGGAVVRLAGDRVVVVMVEAGDPGIVPQHGHHPLLLVRDLEGGGFDAGLEEAVHHLPVSGREVVVSEESPEGVVVAVIASRLGDVLQLHVGGEGEPMSLSLGQDILPQEVSADDRDVPLLEGEVAHCRDLFEVLVGRNRDGADPRLAVEDDLREDDPDPLLRVPIRFG